MRAVKILAIPFVVLGVFLTALIPPLANFARSTFPAAHILRSRVLHLWLKKSFSLLLGTLAYNVFAIFVLRPALKAAFPPLSPLERLQGFFGSTRTTYADLMPYVGPAVWIAGNAFLFVLLNRRLESADRDVSRET